MAITPIDIQQHQFKTRLLGYDTAGVDQFLEMVADELERVSRQHQEVREELARTRSSLQEMQQRESTLKETLLTTQKMVEDIKSNARNEAEIILTEAELKAERVVRDAEQRRIQLINEIQEIKRQKISFETSLRALVESHMRLLDLEVVELENARRDEKLLEEPLPFDEASAPLLVPEDDEED
ncbi:DivIVA domain-containing protein [Geothermobacter hydrogeniphilus]|uniref:Cell division protein DivIVA n=1 Tax=Geothermobacter hydrogeniphilus TaxID=1969733 RepID=A0A1X0XN55_9BACT|nr:DivIVA domain-containing protein [Geothermobacter hydrogeniphilus]ORJ54267.1 cell division protein DivIVA [Geothermobacter hydrogeniphilus]